MQIPGNVFEFLRPLRCDLDSGMDRVGRSQLAPVAKAFALGIFPGASGALFGVPGIFGSKFYRVRGRSLGRRRPLGEPPGSLLGGPELILCP